MGGGGLAIQSDILATTTLRSSDKHPKRGSQFLSSIASTPSASAAPESFDATQVTSSSVKSRGAVYGTSPYSSKAAHVGFSTGGDSRLRVLLPENLSNRSPGLGALVVREEIPSSLPVGCPTYSLLHITRQYCVMVASGYPLILLLSSSGGSAFPGCPLRTIVSYQACVDTPLPEVHLPGDLNRISLALQMPSVFVRTE